MLGDQQATIGVVGALVLALGGILTMVGAQAPFVRPGLAFALIPLVIAFIPAPGQRSGPGNVLPFRLTALASQDRPLSPR